MTHTMSSHALRLWPLVFVVLVGLVSVGCSQEEASYERDEIVVPFRKDGTLDFVRDGVPVVTIDVEIAETDSARARGLMQRTALPERSGMLFIFDREETQSFWMANTPLALDILFVGADSQIVDVRKYTRPFSATNITSSAPAQFVVEVPAGFADTYGILEWDRVRWQRTAH
jgi:uncharacterized protein